MLDADIPIEREHVTNAFKSTRVIMSHSIEHVGAGALDFRILHRFGMFSMGLPGAFGFDKASMRIGLDYGISKRLMIGIGRSTFKEEADAFAKYRLFWQTKGKYRMPFTIELVSGITVYGTPWEFPDRKNYFSSRIAYYHQLIVGRKFSDRLSIQGGPVVVHRNFVEHADEPNDIYSCEIGGRIKLTKRFSVNADYFYIFPNQLPETATMPLSLGVDIETGGHVFQLHITNASAMSERALITETTGKWSKGNLCFGFNLSRVFTIYDKQNHQKPKLTNPQNF